MDLLGAIRHLQSAAVHSRRPDLIPGPHLVPENGSIAEAHRHYEEAVADVARVWDAVKATGSEPPELDCEEILDDQVAERFRAGDGLGAIRAIERWRRAWLDHLHPLLRPVASATPESQAAAVARHLNATQLFDLVDDPQVPEADRDVYRYEILHRADDMIAESEGRRPHANQAVHEMFSGRTRGLLNRPPADLPLSRERRFAPDSRPARPQGGGDQTG